MNKFRKIITALTLAIIVCFGCVLPVACGEGGGDRLVIEGQKTAFYIGDEFTKGDDFKVYLAGNGGKKTDVTAEAAVTPEKGLNMNEIGSYAVTVSYQGKKEVYYIMVNGFDNVLKKLSVNTDNAKVTYKVGESISYEGLKIIGTYENAQHQEYDDIITSLSSLKFKITSEYDTVYENIFTEEGNYTVSISKGTLETSYTVAVSGVNLSSVKSALSLGTFFKKNVVKGTSIVAELVNTTWANTNYEYRFGDNYTYLREDDLGYISEYHTSITNGEVDSVFFYEGTQFESSRKSASMMEGVYYRPWYNDNNKMAYGIEELVGNMYEIAAADPNRDYSDEINLSDQEFSFSFGYLYPGGANRHYYFEVEVSFTLGESYYIKSATVLQKAWFSSEAANPPYFHFTTDSEGITKPNTSAPDYQWKVTCEQQSGKRTEKNPYVTEETKKGVVESYQILYNGTEIKDGDTIKFDRGNANANGHTKQIILSFTNVQPQDANFSTDPLMVTDGTMRAEDSANFFYGKDVTVIGSWNSGNRLIEANRGGRILLVFTTEKITTTIYLDVTGSDPTSLTPRVYNPASRLEATVSQKSAGIGESVYFTCIPDQYANGAFSVALSSGSSDNVTLASPKEDATAEEISANPALKYWTFTASAEGTYVVRMTSTADSAVSTTITFTVREIDFASILNGAYSVTDNAGGVYTITFAPEAQGATDGRVTVSYTEVEEMKTALYEYSVGNGQIVLGNRVSGTEMGVSFSLTVESKLILTDRYFNTYELEASEAN